MFWVVCVSHVMFGLAMEGGPTTVSTSVPVPNTIPEPSPNLLMYWYGSPGSIPITP
ncbi:hypothetical protein Barb7_03041 [Bacteroidales bacterium Barb7]|nr:hypothetical protein Barb7_03041 [Bacteroidales bacterium Barb7]